jgi:glycosidase
MLMSIVVRLLPVAFLFLSLSGSIKAQSQQNQDNLKIASLEGPETRVFYSVFVQSFYDSNGDGIGDIKGLSSKLDYLKDLGVGGLWLLPVHPSPTYHKYDVTDYRDIHPDYGTLDDYRVFIAKAHEMDMIVLLDLVANHTSNQHPWFEKASSGNKRYRDYYVWSDNEEVFENDPYRWHQVRDKNGNPEDGERYYGLFWWEMPDLNYDEPGVREEMIDIGRYWLEEIGIDGFRLDAAEHIYPPEELEKTLDWWEEFRKAMKEINPDVFIVGEVWGGSEKTSPYLKSGFDAGFDFELSDTIRKSILSGRDLGIIETLKSIYTKYREANPGFQDATILTNHDMERVMTEFNRDYNKASVAAALLLTLPGNPVIYYGEEIGMLGEKPDEYIREPFLWSIEGKDPGQTHWEIPYKSSSKTVKPLSFQAEDPSSIYNLYKDLIKTRNDNSALQRGSISRLQTANQGIVAFFRYSNDQAALVIINLTNEMQRIPTPRGIDGFEMAYSNYGVFKINQNEISLQPYSIFILTRGGMEDY